MLKIKIMNDLIQCGMCGEYQLPDVFVGLRGEKCACCETCRKRWRKPIKKIEGNLDELVGCSGCKKYYILKEFIGLRGQKCKKCFICREKSKKQKKKYMDNVGVFNCVCGMQTDNVKSLIARHQNGYLCKSRIRMKEKKKKSN